MNDKRTNIHAVPEHLPTIPDGEVYIGKGPLDVPMDFEGHMFYEGRWTSHIDGGGNFGGCCAEYYTAPIDSEVARYVLARRVPDGVPVLPEGYVYAGTGGELHRLYDDKPNDYLWLNEVCGEWRFPQCPGWCGPTLYAAPIDSDLGREILGMESGKQDRGIPTADDVRGILTWGVETPDLIIPREAALEMNAYLWIEELTNAGYRLEIDSSGIRGWKEK